MYKNNFSSLGDLGLIRNQILVGLYKICTMYTRVVQKRQLNMVVGPLLIFRFVSQSLKLFFHD